MMTSKSDPRGYSELKLCVHVSVMGYYRFTNFRRNRRGSGSKWQKAINYSCKLKLQITIDRMLSFLAMSAQSRFSALPQLWHSPNFPYIPTKSASANDKSV